MGDGRTGPFARISGMDRKKRSRNGVRALSLVCGIAVVALFTLFVSARTESVAAAGASTALVDTLGQATTASQFSVSGAGGNALLPSQHVGPRFVLTRATLITEVGAFVNNCESIISGVPQCPATSAIVVDIRPEGTAGGPDPNVVVASFALSHDNDPLVVRYESVSPSLLLPAGTYFALFRTQGSDAGFLLGSATDPFVYRAEEALIGILRPELGDWFVFSTGAAVRILGDPVAASRDECKDEGWRGLRDDQGAAFGNQGECVSFVSREVR